MRQLFTPFWMNFDFVLTNLRQCCREPLDFGPDTPRGITLLCDEQQIVATANPLEILVRLHIPAWILKLCICHSCTGQLHQTQILGWPFQLMI